jgi:hypothetical protein
LFDSRAVAVHLSIAALFVSLINHPSAVLFSQNKPVISNQPAVFLSQNKPTPAISHQPNEQAEHLWTLYSLCDKRVHALRSLALVHLITSWRKAIKDNLPQWSTRGSREKEGRLLYPLDSEGYGSLLHPPSAPPLSCCRRPRRPRALARNPPHPTALLLTIPTVIEAGGVGL